MKKGLTEMVFVLDRSGSMQGLTEDTIGGFNSMLERQKGQEGEAVVTTVLFDDQYEVIHDRFPLRVVRPMTKKEYYARGCTALLDALGKTIHKTVNAQRHLPEEERAERVVFVITTDGLENASREYNYQQIREMIEKQKKKYGWEFLFLGANMDAVEEAQKFGIGADRSVTFQNDSQGVALNYQVLSETLVELRAPTCVPLGENWKEKIEADYRKRGKKNS